MKRDIKPENLFLIGDPERAHVKLLDFGISKLALESDVRRPSDPRDTHLAVGTPAYMSPEQMRGVPDLDGRSDLFSIGCVLYELLAGQLPFERASAMSSCAAVLEEEPPALRELRPDLAPALADIVTRCLRKRRDERFQDTAELARALVPFGTGRLASYPAQCQSHLNGERLGRRSTPPGAPSRPSTDTLATPVVSASVYPFAQATPSELLLKAPDPFRASTVLRVTPAPTRARGRSLAWFWLLVAAGVSLVYWSASRDRQPILYEARPRALPTVDSTANEPHVTPELEQPSSPALPDGLSEADKPRSRRRRKLEARPEAGAQSRSNGTPPPRLGDDPDVGF